MFGSLTHASQQLIERQETCFASAASRYEGIGNLSLPETDLINAYLRTNTTFRNFLLPDYPPLQLIKCDVFVVQLGALFSFYTADHPGGCQEAPQKQLKPMAEHSAKERFWRFELRNWLCFWPLSLTLVASGLLFLQYIERMKTAVKDQHRPQWRTFTTWVYTGLAVLFICSFYGTLPLAGRYWGDVDLLQELHLPDPAITINPFLRSSDISLNLHRCTVLHPRSTKIALFDFYVGMPENICSQFLAAGAIYADYVAKAPFEAYGRSGLERFGLFLARWILSVSTLFGLILLFLEKAFFLAYIFDRDTSSKRSE